MPDTHRHSASPAPDAPATAGTATEGCCPREGRGPSRRAFIRGAAIVGGATAATAVHGTAFTQTAYAATPADSVLVVLSMRGAADGLSLVVPHADPVYYQARPSIQVPKNRLLVPNAMFGLHPALAPLMPLWNTGKMAAVHATGLPAPNRSHFSAMEELEDADPGSRERIGWINRLVGVVGEGSPLDAVQFGSGVPATQLFGPHPTLPANGADTVKLAGPKDATYGPGREAALTTLWSTDSPLQQAAADAMDVVEDFAPVHNVSPIPANGAVYPANNDLASALKDAARTIRADVGAEVITVDHGSWDHHQWIGTPDNGSLLTMVRQFAAAVEAFFTDLGPLANKVTVVTISEFGRRVRENANQGLDHGHGNVMFVLGAGVKGGYYGKWPGLRNTVDADLLVTTDYRSVLSEVLTARFNTTVGQVFPGFTPETIGVMRTV